MNQIAMLASLIKRRAKLPAPEKYVLFLGAGASLSSGPSLFSTIIAASGCCDYDEFSALFAGFSHQERFTFLSEHLTVRSVSRGAVLLAELIHDGNFSLILTTNFDTLLETALAATGLPPNEYEVIVNEPGLAPASLADRLRYSTPRIKILKLHGDIARRRFALTHTETTKFHEPVAECVRRIFKERDVIIVGSQFADLDLLRNVTKDGGSIWTVNPSPPSGHLRTLLEVRNSLNHAIIGDEGHFDCFIKKLATEMTGANQSEYEINWTLLCPISYPTQPHASQLEGFALLSETETSSTFLVSESNDERILLRLYGYDVAVIVRQSRFHGDRISDFARARRVTYHEILRDRRGIGALASELAYGITSTNTTRWTGEVAYCLSMVEIIQAGWQEVYLGNALALFACPSVMYLDDVGDERFDAHDDSLIDESREDAVLSTGCSIDDCDSFAVENNIFGCSSWSGIAYQLYRRDRNIRMTLENFEIDLQGLWWGIHSAKRAFLSNHDGAAEQVKPMSFWRRELSRLRHFEATESLVLRRFKESVIKTSRIAEEYAELREMMT